jgi:hypothetical protein
MGALRGRYKADLISSRIESYSELDVFDTRTTNSCVEPSDVLKRTLSDRTQTSPKGKRIGPSILVHVVVSQICIERGYPTRPRSIIVGPKRCCNSQVFDNSRYQCPNRTAVYNDVGINKNQYFGPCNRGAPIAPKRRTDWRPSIAQNLHRKALRNS